MFSCCGQGFLCRDDVAQEDPAKDGCLIQCNEGWKLVADPRNGGSWYCTNISTPICPGKFNTGGWRVVLLVVVVVTTEVFYLSECACTDGNNCPIGECECDGQLRVSWDCKTAQ